MPLFELVVGDYSGDGHRRTYRQLCKANESVANVRDAYTLGCSILGRDICQEECTDYQSSNLSKSALSLLEAHGWVCPPIFGMDVETWLDIYVFVATLGDPSLRIKKVDVATIDTGGYGIYD